MRNEPIKIESPCPKLWSEMRGDDAKRFCEHCHLHVNNLSAMTSREQSQFLTESAGGHVCVTYEVAPNGSMKSRPRWRWLAAIAALLPLILQACTGGRRTTGAVTMGKPIAPGRIAIPVHQQEDPKRVRVIGEMPVMGKIAPPPTPTPEPKPVVGRMPVQPPRMTGDVALPPR